MNTYTVIVRELTSPFPPVYPEPLIYTVELPIECTDPEDHFATEIAKERYEEIEGGDAPAEILEAIKDGLCIDFAFEGDLTAAFDFRE